MPTKNNVFAQEYLIKFLYANTAFPQKDTTDAFFFFFICFFFHEHLRFTRQQGRGKNSSLPLPPISQTLRH